MAPSSVHRVSISNLVHAPAGDTFSRTSTMSATDSPAALPSLPSMRYYAGLSHLFPPESSNAQREPSPPPTRRTPTPDGMSSISSVSTASPLLRNPSNSSPLPVPPARLDGARLHTSPLRATPSPLPLPVSLLPATPPPHMPPPVQYPAVLPSDFTTALEASRISLRVPPSLTSSSEPKRPYARGVRSKGVRRPRNRPFQCARCPAVFQSRGHKTNHEATVHDGKRPHKCAHCPARFGLKWNLATHVRRVHEQQRPFVCDHCDMAFAQRYDLKRHSRLLHGTQAGLYKCGCGASFDKKRDLAGHVARVHPAKVTAAGDGMAQVLSPLRCA